MGEVNGSGWECLGASGGNRGLLKQRIVGDGDEMRPKFNYIKKKGLKKGEIDGIDLKGYEIVERVRKWFRERKKKVSNQPDYI